MTRPASAFPVLRRVFTGYLHEDFLAESGSPESALRTFLDDADPGERRRFRREAAKFLAQAAVMDLSELHDVLQALGSRWIPASHQALVAVLSDVAGIHKSPES